MELTEPWKSMNLPIDGALIERSSSSTLGVRFVTIKAEDAALPYAALKQSLMDAGWSVKYERSGPPRWKTTFNAAGFASVSLSVYPENGRPYAWISGLAE